MKFRILAMMVLMLRGGPALANSGWFWQNPLPQGNALRAIAAPTTDIVVAVGSFGVILRSADGGATWTLQSSGTDKVFLGVSFTDANTGTAVGEDSTILRTLDGGATWTPQDSGTTNWLFGVSFTDTSNGTAVGLNGTIVRTIDGGATWTDLSQK